MKPRTAIKICLGVVIIAMAQLSVGETPQTKDKGKSADEAATKGTPQSGRSAQTMVPATFPVGKEPYGVAFDGAFIWVANFRSDTVSKVRPSDGASLGTFNVGRGPIGVVSDGTNIWVTNNIGGSVTELRASDGKILATFEVGPGPFWPAFDGANL